MDIRPPAVPDFRPAFPDFSEVFKNVDFRNAINAGGELYFGALQSYVQERESKLGADEVLEVLHHQTGRPINVHTIGFRGPQVFTLVGRDPDGHEVHVVAPSVPSKSRSA